MSTAAVTIPSNHLFASIDIGTNSFKLLIIRAYPTGKFLTLTRQTLIFSSPAPPPNHSLSLSLQSLIHFKSLISTHEIDPHRTFTVATHAVRQTENQKEFVNAVCVSTGFDVNVLTGEEGPKFLYLGVLQFLPIWEKFILCVDIGDGSTEFVIGREGRVVYCFTLKLGHVSLSEEFGDIEKMREVVRSVVEGSGLVEEVKRVGLVLRLRSGLVELLGSCRTENFFKGRSDSIVAGAVLLEEIFDLIGIEEMEVSGYGLGEGVIAERLDEVFEGYDLSANARWRSVEWEEADQTCPTVC